jgi:hypothetical protein
LGIEISRNHEIQKFRSRNLRISWLWDFEISGFRNFWIYEFGDFMISGIRDFVNSRFRNFGISEIRDFWITGFRISEFRVFGFSDFWHFVISTFRHFWISWFRDFVVFAITGLGGFVFSGFRDWRRLRGWRGFGGDRFELSSVLHVSGFSELSCSSKSYRVVTKRLVPDGGSKTFETVELWLGGCNLRRLVHFTFCFFPVRVYLCLFASFLH